MKKIYGSIIWLKALAVLVLCINTVGALYGGWALITDPSGGKLRMPLEFLENSMFKNYLAPGIILFAVNGLFGLIVLFYTFTSRKKYFYWIIAQGIILSGWIVMQMLLLLKFYYLQFVLGTFGLGMIICGFLIARRINANA